MNKSLRLLFGNWLKGSGYKMFSVNHYEKKYKNFYFYIDRDIADHLLLRLMVKNKFGEIKCIRNEFFENLSSMSQNELLNTILERERIYLNLINDQDNKINKYWDIAYLYLH